MEREQFDHLVKEVGLEEARKIEEYVANLEKRRKISSKRVATRRMRKIAIHEAGHAVIDHHFGAKLGKITIEPNFETKKTASTRSSWEREKPNAEMSAEAQRTLLIDRISQRLCSFVGGAAAEYVYAGRPKRFRVHGGSEDFETAENLLREVFACGRNSSAVPNVDINLDIPYREMIIEAFYQAADILESKWKAVLALSKALIERRTITGQEIIEILDMSLSV